MDRLPSVDVHSRRVAATPERTWEGVVKLVRGRLTRPAPAGFVALWGLEPTSGFAVAEQTPPRRLALRGRHRFSRYELAFEVEPRPDGVTVRAHTSAEFPGAAGRLYRAVVIGSGGHRFFVRRMIEQIAQFAERS
jgi:hypothetical protein